MDHNSSFSIYLKNHRLYIELRAVNILYELSLQTVLSPAIEYQIQYLQQNTYVEIKILSSSQLIESVNMTLNNSFQMDFRDVCVGGGLLEVVNYYGIIEYVFFRHFALAETQRFFQTVISRSDVIQFTNASETPASLSFERYNLRSQHISFEFRLQPEGTGVLLRSQNDRYQLMIVTLNGELTIINTDLSNQPSLVQCENTSVNDGLWHNISIQKAGGGVGTALGLRITLDNIHVCVSNDNSFELGLRSLATTSPLELGVTTDLYIGSSVPYIGCIQNIVFELGTETFRPNLEVKSRVEERFGMAGCFFCTSQMSDSLSCQNGGRCSDRGTSTDPECACPAEYTGQQCESKEHKWIATRLCKRNLVLIHVYILPATHHWAFTFMFIQEFPREKMHNIRDYVAASVLRSQSYYVLPQELAQMHSLVRVHCMCKLMCHHQW